MQADGSPLSTVLFVVALSIIPLVLMTATSFVKISVVFSILKNALGAGDVPSGTVITALAAILSLYVMAPVGERMADAAAPSLARLSEQGAMLDLDLLTELGRTGGEPLREFLVANAGPRERQVFFELAREARPEAQRAAITDRDALVVLPAFVVTELSEAFQIGFLIFLPFLVLELVIANLLVALGLTQLTSTQVSMPFKLLLFVLVDGWFVLARALVLGYA